MTCKKMLSFYFIFPQINMKQKEQCDDALNIAFFIIN